jgi:DNA (cytosine-5)-methyltransferase 1
MRFIDLFAGLGGFHLATAKLGGKCVFASEIDTKLRKLYEKNFGILPCGDLREINIKDIPPHDLLCAGFPCQPFSKAGSQHGRKDKIRGTVFDSVLDILKYHQPEFLILENVAHFVHHDKGNTYRRVEKALGNLGYSIRKAQLSPHNYGIPQIRERMYLVGRIGELNEFKWPSTESKISDLSINEILYSNTGDANKLTPQVIECIETWNEFINLFPKDKELPSFPVWAMEFGATYPYDSESLFDYKLSILRKMKGAFGQPLDYYFRKEILDHIPSYARYRECAFPDWKRKFIQGNRELYRSNRKWIDLWLPKIRKFPASLQKLEWNCKGEERSIWNYVIQFRASGVRIKRPNTSPSLVAMTTTQVPIIGWEKRYMSVRECARLQSMEDLRYLPNETAAFKALGNAVNVKVAGLVLNNLIDLKKKAGNSATSNFKTDCYPQTKKCNFDFIRLLL